MLNPGWSSLTVFALAGGVLIILAPKFVVKMNRALNKALLSMDDLIMRYRHAIGVLLLLVAYLCFQLALFVPAG